MSGILTKWSVLQRQHAASDDLDADGAVLAKVIERWIDAACRAYLDQCSDLERTRARDDLELQCRHDSLPAAALAGRPSTVVVTATATEIWPTAFAISVRIRPIDGTSDRALNVVCKVQLQDATTGDASDLGNAVRDELIALEHAARHFN